MFLFFVIVLTYTLFAFYGYFGSLEPGGNSIKSELPKKSFKFKNQEPTEALQFIKTDSFWGHSCPHHIF